MSRTTPQHRRGRPRSAALAACALVLAAAGTGTALTGSASAAPAAGCTVDYKIQNEWATGFTTEITVQNTGTALSSWDVEWTFAGNQQVTQGWNADVSQSGRNVTASSPSWGGSLAAGGSANFGFQATYSGSNAVPASFTLNGVTCTADGSDPGDPAWIESPASRKTTIARTDDGTAV
ncbi:cellulose-binding domain-containing protein, partial [Streptomyces sp. NPDC048845]|uniref:cellulose-binding domain-containing protein n=1 Tax=Streptomyces sp. NPDC048845 TaxID=3155390 RepID=UPI00342E54AB